MDSVSEVKEGKLPVIPCFLCGNGLLVKQTIRNKPSFICDPCGIQVFVRKQKGIGLLDNLIASLKNPLVSFSEGEDYSFEVISLTNRLTHLRAKLDEVNNKLSLTPFTEDKGFGLVVKALEKEIRRIEGRLKKLA